MITLYNLLLIRKVKHVHNGYNELIFVYHIYSSIFLIVFRFFLITIGNSTIILSIIKNITMKIQFRTYSTVEHVVYICIFSCIVFAISCYNTHLISLFVEAEESVVHSRGFNVTRKTALFY